MLGTTSIGAIWSSCYTPISVSKAHWIDSDRSNPSYWWPASDTTTTARYSPLRITSTKLWTLFPSIQTVVWYDPDAEDDFEAIYSRRVGEQSFARLSFDHPVYVMYSSGTTGKPKCIVHGAGGTLLQHLKEHQLHVDIKRKDTLFFFTTTWLDDVELVGFSACVWLQDRSLRWCAFLSKSRLHAGTH